MASKVIFWPYKGKTWLLFTISLFLNELKPYQIVLNFEMFRTKNRPAILANGFSKTCEKVEQQRSRKKIFLQVVAKFFSENVIKFPHLLNIFFPWKSVHFSKMDQEIIDSKVKMAANLSIIQENEEISQNFGGARPKQYSNVIVDDSPLQNHMEKNKKCKF